MNINVCIMLGCVRIRSSLTRGMHSAPLPQVHMHLSLNHRLSIFWLCSKASRHMCLAGVDMIWTRFYWATHNDEKLVYPSHYLPKQPQSGCSTWDCLYPRSLTCFKDKTAIFNLYASSVALLNVYCVSVWFYWVLIKNICTLLYCMLLSDLCNQLE